eukprot:scaffold61183_cov62-Phaeocystis_antarctica.AAC.4
MCEHALVQRLHNNDRALHLEDESVRRLLFVLRDQAFRFHDEHQATWRRWAWSWQLQARRPPRTQLQPETVVGVECAPCRAHADGGCEWPLTVSFKDACVAAAAASASDAAAAAAAAAAAHVARCCERSIMRPTLPPNFSQFGSCRGKFCDVTAQASFGFTLDVIEPVRELAPIYTFGSMYMKEVIYLTKPAQ